MSCLQCGDEAYAHVEWQVGGNPQEADLCKVCAGEMWRQFGLTTVFKFSRPEIVATVNEIV
jgi:hypothetical protein